MNSFLYRLADWGMRRHLWWLSDLIFRYRCPAPIGGVCSPRSCFKLRQCGCDNANRFR